MPLFIPPPDKRVTEQPKDSNSFLSFFIFFIFSSHLVKRILFTSSKSQEIEASEIIFCKRDIASLCDL